MHLSNIASRSISTGVYRAAICVPGLEKENKDTESFAISSGLALYSRVLYHSDILLRISSQKWISANFKSIMWPYAWFAVQQTALHSPSRSHAKGITYSIDISSDDNVSAQLQDESDHEYDTGSQAQDESKDMDH